MTMQIAQADAASAPLLYGRNDRIPDHSFSHQLQGPRAFYHQADYLEATTRDFAQVDPLPVTATYDTDYKIVTFIKFVFTYVLFPIFIYRCLQSYAARKGILPSCVPREENYATNVRTQINLLRDWKFKRITLGVDEEKIDVIIMGKAATLGNGRWMIQSMGNGEFMEDSIRYGGGVKQILTRLNANTILFNYPNVGSSSGSARRDAMVKAYRTVLNFLEDRNLGIGAREIIPWGHSIGGGVQGNAMEEHPLKPDVRYVMIKRGTFSDLSSVISNLISPLLGFAVKLLDWNMGSVKSSKNLQAPEIILQSANVNVPTEIHNSALLAHDGIIAVETSLANALLNDPTCPRNNKAFIGIPEAHNDPLDNIDLLVQKIENFLRIA